MHRCRAKELASDPSVTPIRGQVVCVENPGIDQVLLDEGNPDGITYIVPRSADCILGGTAEVGADGLEPDPDVARGILLRCTELEPRLHQARVLAHKVGLRPGRPTIRLETDELPDARPCVHNYGHGGAGVTLSWGAPTKSSGSSRPPSASGQSRYPPAAGGTGVTDG